METLVQDQPDRAAWLTGGQRECSVFPVRPVQAFRFVMLGAPGIGKGTQARLLCSALGMCHLSTDDVFRTSRCLSPQERTPTLECAHDHLRRGEPVPDETMLALVTERSVCLHCHGGFLLEGFPRTVAQAMDLENLMPRERIVLNAVIHYETDDEQTIQRLAGRRICANCKAIFHVTTCPPHYADLCDFCGGTPVQSDDESLAALRARIAAHHAAVAPLVEFYRHRALLVSIAADGPPEEILERTVAALMTQSTKTRARDRRHP